MQNKKKYFFYFLPGLWVIGSEGTFFQFLFKKLLENPDTTEKSRCMWA